MKTTIELPDTLLRTAKSLAAQEGMTLKALFSIALKDEIKTLTSQSQHVQPWRKHFGAMKDLHDENARIQKEIDEEFDKVDMEIWT